MTHHLIPSNNHVFLACEGNSSPGEVMSAWREVQGVLAETGWNRVLVDVTAVRTNPDTAQLFDLAKLLWQNFPESGRIALVVRWDQSRFAKLLEMLVRTLGMGLTVFVSEEQAEAWVLEGTQDEQAVEVFAQ